MTNGCCFMVPRYLPWRLKSRDPAGDAASLTQDGWMDGRLFDLGLREHTELYAHQADPRLMGDWLANRLSTAMIDRSVR